MLRRGLAALLMGVICAGSVTAGDPALNQSAAPRTGLFSLFKQKNTTGRRTVASPKQNSGAVQRAVVNDARGQKAQPQVRQTAGRPQDDVVVVGKNGLSGRSAPAPTPQASRAAAESQVPKQLSVPRFIETDPQLPNQQTVSGPQMFSTTSPATFSNPVPVYPGNNYQQYSPPVPVHLTSAAPFSPISNPEMGQPVMDMGCPASGGTYGGYYGSGSTGGMYPQTGAALYPAPRPGIPQQVGGTMIQNQAFHPHEMLYAHRYKAMYPPYYYKVNGGWMVTPFGVWSHEDWHLQGTTVDVKYKSHISPFSLYHGRR